MERGRPHGNEGRCSRSCWRSGGREIGDEVDDTAVPDTDDAQAVRTDDGERVDCYVGAEVPAADAAQLRADVGNLDAHGVTTSQR